ncbi:MAG TPA: VOC family protein [Acidimicrobiales bacterium]|nr:VOC family protein [Acidimicrobiales bacterium]
MTLHIESFTVDARDPLALATWWSEAIGWVICSESEDGVEVDLCERLDPDGGHPYPELSFVGDGGHGEGQEKIHLDLNSFSTGDQHATVERLIGMGATRADVGQAPDAPFTVLADPEGNHFCVLDPRPEYAHLGSVAGYTVAAHDAAALRDVWATATGWDVTRDEPDHVVLAPPDGSAPIEIVTRPTMPPQRRQGAHPPRRRPRRPRRPGGGGRPAPRPRRHPRRHRPDRRRALGRPRRPRGQRALRPLTPPLSPLPQVDRDGWHRRRPPAPATPTATATDFQLGGSRS